jgi:large subunit ribosomal protein L15
MVIRHRRKVRRLRGSRSHGWGVQKDHKGKGMQGGAGKAGTISHRWIQVIIEAKANRVKPLGKYGFKRPQQYLKKGKTINVSHLNESVETLVANGKATKDGDIYTVDLQAIGIEKLLAQGVVTKKMKLIVPHATERAISKIENAGGSVEIIEK